MQASSAVSNMVANQSNLVKPKEFLKKLKRKGNERYFTNTKSWDKGIGVCFSTFGLVKFLSEDYSIKVPKEQKWQVAVDQDLKAMLNKNAKQVRHEKNEVVKKEKAEKGELLSSSSSPKKGVVSTASEQTLASLDDRQAKYEEIVRRNAARLAEKQRKKEKSGESRAGSELTSYVNPLSEISEDEREYNPDATVCVETTEGPRREKVLLC